MLLIQKAFIFVLFLCSFLINPVASNCLSCIPPQYLDQEGFCSICKTGSGYDLETSSCIQCKPPKYVNSGGYCIYINSDIDYQVSHSPVLWAHIGIIAVSIIALTLVLTLLKETCLLEMNQTYQRFDLTDKIGISFLICNRFINFWLFKNPQVSKANRLQSFLIVLIAYSFLSAVFVPGQKVQRHAHSGFFGFTEVHIGFIPILVNGIILGGMLFSSLSMQQKQYAKDQKIFAQAPTKILKQTMFLTGLAGLVLILALLIKGNHLKQDIWAANFVICLIIEATIIPIFSMIGQTIVIKSGHKDVQGLADFSMKKLLEPSKYKKDFSKFEQVPRSLPTNRDTIV